MGEVVNPYRRAIEGRSRLSADAQQGLRSALDKVIGLWPSAWQGGLSSQVLESLVAVGWDAGVTVDRVDAEFLRALSIEPYVVDEHAWQIRWRNLIGW